MGRGPSRGRTTRPEESLAWLQSNARIGLSWVPEKHCPAEVVSSLKTMRNPGKTEEGVDP